jgi:hypothetical protein
MVYELAHHIRHALLNVLILNYNLSKSGGGSDSGTQLSLTIDAWSLVVPSENAKKASQALVDL